MNTSLFGYIAVITMLAAWVKGNSIERWETMGAETQWPQRVKSLIVE